MRFRRKFTALLAGAATASLIATGGLSLTPGVASAASPGYTYAVTTSIGLGSNTQPESVAVDPDTHTAYTANLASDTVSVIDEFTNTVTASIGVGTNPTAIAVDPSTDTVYVTNDGDGDVSVINGATNTVTATVPAGRFPDAIAVDPSTHTVYVDNNGDQTVTVINGVTNAVQTTITGVATSLAIAVNPLTHTVYATNDFADSVTVIDGVNDTVTAVVALPAYSYPRGVAVNPATQTVYVVGFLGTFAVINGTTNTLTATSSLGPDTSAGSVAVDTSSATVYVAGDSNDPHLYVLNGASDAITAAVNLGQSFGQNALAVDPVLHTAYVIYDTGNSGVITMIGQGTTPTTTTATTLPPVAAGSPITLSATVNPAPDAGTVSFDLNGKVACSAQPVDPTTGIANCTLTAPTTAGTLSEAVAFTGGEGYLSSQGKATLTVTPAALNHLQLTPTTSSIPAGANQTYAAAGFDQYSNNLGDLSTQTTFTISPDGNCTGPVCTTTTAGTHTVTATDGPTTATATLTVTAASATTVTIDGGDNQTAATGHGFAAPLSVTVTDGYGNPVSNAVVSFTILLASTGTANFGGTSQTGTATTNTSGVATATTLDAGTTTGAVAVSATTPSASGPVGATFMETVTAVGPARADLSVTIDAPHSLARGNSAAVTVTVTNIGPATAANLLIGLYVPRSLVITNPGGGTVHYGLDLFSASSLAAGQHLTYTVSVKAGSVKAVPLLIAGADSATNDPNLLNNLTAALTSVS
jgi:YVTN family beta-propeller protein